MKHQKKHKKKHEQISLNKQQGTISVSAKGTGYVRVLDQKEDVEIDFKHLNTALHGDTVEIILHPKKHGRQTGEVTKIISRAKTRFAGILEEDPSTSLRAGTNIFFLKPDDTKMYTDILIPEKFLNNAKTGQKVFAEIVLWNDPRKAPEGKIIKVLGKPGDNDTEMYAIAIEKGFVAELPNKVEEEAKKIKQGGIIEKDYLGRRDFRKTLTFCKNSFLFWSDDKNVIAMV